MTPTPITGMTRAVRRRELAGDRRAGSFARGRARRKQYNFLRRNWVLFVATFVVTSMVLGVTIYFTPNDFARGVVLGGGLVAVASAMWLWVVEATGTAPTMMGDLGEQWSARVLRKLRRDGWFVVNHVALKTRDIDHVLVGPGGVIAVETKWTASDWVFEPLDPRIAAAADQARENAHDLTWWHELRSLGTGAAQSAVFLWGAGARDLPSGFDVGGTAVVSGFTASTWRSQLGHDLLTAEQIEAAWHALDAHCRKRDPREAVAEPLPASLWEWTWRVIFALLAACAGFLASARVLSSSQTLAWGALGWAVLLGIGVVASRRASIRYLALSWTFGILGTGVVAGVAVLVDYLG